MEFSDSSSLRHADLVFRLACAHVGACVVRLRQCGRARRNTWGCILGSESTQPSQPAMPSGVHVLEFLKRKVESHAELTESLCLGAWLPRSSNCSSMIGTLQFLHVYLIVGLGYFGRVKRNMCDFGRGVRGR